MSPHTNNGWICQVKFDHEPYYKQIHIFMDWLVEHIGPEGIRWYYDDSLNCEYRVFFKSEEDKVKFILKWI